MNFSRLRACAFTSAIVIFLFGFVAFTAHAQVAFPNRGGTGTGVSPTLGQVLVGQANGSYLPQATSTLNIIANLPFSTEGGLEAYLSDVLDVFTNNDGSLQDDNLSNNTTSDLLEGTNLYYTVARAQTALLAGYPAIFGNATTTSATSTNLAVTGSFDLLGTVITNVSTWFNGLFDTRLATKTTANLTEGSNLYFTNARAREAISETVVGLDYASGTGILSATAGYFIPLVASTTEWATAYGWGNHAAAGYLTSVSWGAIGGTLSNQTDLQVALNGKESILSFTYPLTRSANTISLAFGTTTANTWSQLQTFTSGVNINGETFTDLTGSGLSLSTGALTLDRTGAWTGTFDGQEGIYYLDRANHSGTQLASTISDFSATARDLFSSSALGLTYTSGTGVFSLTSGYIIPLTASTTNWNAFYDAPSSRIMDGTGLTWSANTLNCDTASGSVQGCLSAADWTTFNGKQAAGNYLTALTGDVTAAGPGSTAATLATVNSNVGTFGSETQAPALTVNGKGLITAVSNTTITPAVGSITGLGTSVATALGVNVGTTGAFVVNGGALGTPSSGTLTNTTGLLPAGINLTKGNFLVGNDAGVAQATSTIFISSTGNVGVGTTTPWGMLSVTNTTANPSFVVEDAASPDTSPFAVTAAGDVGVGTSTPPSKFTIEGTNNATGGLRLCSTAGTDNCRWAAYANGNTSVAFQKLSANGVFGFLNSAGGEELRISNNGFVGLASTSPMSRLVVSGTITADNINATSTSSTSKFSGILEVITRFIGVISAAFTPTTEGEIGIDTTSNQFKFFSNGSARVLGDGNFYPAFSYATSTAWTGTTTIPLGPAYVGETWNGVKCFSDTGTLNVSFYDGTNRMNMFNASTTVGTVGLVSNNTFTADEKRYVDVGTPASTPTKISCTVSKSLTAN